MDPKTQTYQQPYPPPPGAPGAAGSSQWGAPPPPAAGYAAAPGYATPAPGYGAPPPGAPGYYGAPPPGATGYGAPGQAYYAPQPQPAYAPNTHAQAHAYAPGYQGGHDAETGLAGGTVHSVDHDTATAMAFAEVAVRNGFVRKVFGIVALQLAVTVGFSCMCIFVTPLNEYLRVNAWPFWSAWIFALALILVLSCVPNVRRQYPLNVALLATFTVAEAWLVGTITARYSTEAVMLAFLVTTAAVAALTLFAVNTKVDATKWHSLLFVGLIVFLVLLFVGIFWISTWWYLVIAGFAALLFSAYLVYDIQMVMGGKMYSISPDEYVMAALSIYLDVVNLFLAILSIIGIAGN